MEPVSGIGPESLAYQASTLPLSYTDMLYFVPNEGFEPSRLTALASKASVAASYTSRAWLVVPVGIEPTTS
jgi:hypothetical protein